MAPTNEQIEELERARLSALVDNTAQSVFKHLEELENRRSQVRDRWIWELLQNARDASSTSSKVRVFLQILSDTLVFRHNGEPFTNEEISHLIFHGSSKQGHSSDATVGHFGSGFISTHLISRKVRVQGRLQNGSSFDFELNRQAASAEELRLLMDGSWKAFLDSLRETEHSIGGFTTEFIYPVSSEAESLVESGIQALESCAAYVLVFNPELSTLEIQADPRRLQLTRGESVEVANGVNITEILIDEGLTPPRSRFVATTSGHDVTLAVTGVESNGQVSVDVELNVPRLFLAFPLHDSQKFCFPAIINSESFTPTEDRGGVYLGTADTEDVKKNEELLKSACNLLTSLASVLACNKWENTASLSSLYGSYDKAWSGDGWYHRLLKDSLIEQLREAPLLRNLAGDLIQPKDAWIPADISETDHHSLWTLLASLRSAETRLPASQDSLTWFRNLEHWKSISGSDFPEAMSIEKLAKHLATNPTLTDFGKTLNDDSGSMEWLNTFHSLILKNEERELFDDLTLIPNQNLVFQKRNSIATDGGIDEALKDLAEKLELDIRSRLLHPKVKDEGVRSLIPHSVSEEEVLQELLGQLQKKAEDPITQIFKEVNLSLFAWLVARDRLDCLESFPFITRAEAILKVKSGEQAVTCLAPVKTWPDGAQEFAELFPKKRVLAGEYYEASPSHAVWEHLASAGLVYLSPLVKTREHVDAFLQDLSDEAEHRSTTTVQQTQLLFLIEDDIGLIDSARKSRVRSLGLLTFLLEYALDADRDAFNEGEAACQCGETHRFYLARWLSALKQRKWVFGSANRSLKPTAESLAEIIQENSRIGMQLTEGRGIQFIKALGISPSDLSLRLLSQDEAERVDYIRSLSDIQSTVGTGVVQLSAFASALREDPEVLNIINDRAEVRSRIRGNQKIGGQIEQLLADSLRGLGFKVTRTGIGSDYEVETDLTDEGEEFILKVEGHSRTHLIEIKCTTTDDVRMTPKQAEVASQQQDRFSLCVVPLSSQELAEAEVSESAQFVVDIGAQIEPLWNNYLSLEDAKKQTKLRIGDIVLEISKEHTRFRVARAVWDSGIDLNAFVSFLKGSEPHAKQ